MKEYLVQPKTKVHLSQWKTDDKKAFSGGKEEADAEVEKLRQKLYELQELLYAEHKKKVLVVLQGMDTCGKDGTIRMVFSGINPQGVRISSFGVPTHIELDRDYLWRVHLQTPRRGEIAIFNRSHYEDVLTVRVHDVVPEKVWRKRFDQINEFERMLSEEGTTIIKFFLYISKDEQKRRLQARLDNPQKRWKFKESDLKERKFWNSYMKAFNDVLSKTSTPWAPWYIVPGDTKWYRNLVVARTIVDTLKGLEMSYPKLEYDPKKIRIT